jgi:hypothetical protein
LRSDSSARSDFISLKCNSDNLFHVVSNFKNDKLLNKLLAALYITYKTLKHIYKKGVRFHGLPTWKDWYKISYFRVLFLPDICMFEWIINPDFSIVLRSEIVCHNTLNLVQVVDSAVETRLIILHHLLLACSLIIFKLIRLMEHTFMYYIKLQKHPPYIILKKS